MLTPLAFALAYASGCLLALLRHPIFGLATYVAAFYIHPPSRWWGDELPALRWSLFAALITLIGVMLHSSWRHSSPVLKSGLVRGLLLFIGWLLIQSAWALDQPMHWELINLYTKYLLLVALICWCINSEQHLRYFLLAHAAGCFYLGIIVFTEYEGGRFEGFGGPGIDEANAAALQIVSGVVVTFVVFLSGRWWERLTAIGFMPFTLNALVATISRSGFLALAVAGVLFNIFAPRPSKGRIRVYSICGVLLFLALTNPFYWARIDTITYAGEQVEGVDTGSGRLDLMQAQVKMFLEYPLGCGHRCTVTLSPRYLDESHLTGRGQDRGRASHSTFMSLLVEQGIPGIIFYVLFLIWMVKVVVRLRPVMREKNGLLPFTYTATVGILGAITIGDIFVDYLKFEARIWFVGLLIALDRLSSAALVEEHSGMDRSQSSCRQVHLTADDALRHEPPLQLPVRKRRS